jgi:hypothetical protein
MISILIPSRQRAKLLKSSLATLGNEDYEALVWVDDDDPELELYMDLPATVFIKERVGYSNFYQMVNFLAAHAKGNWLLLWNDDMRIESKGWVDRIEAHDSRQPLVLNFWDVTNMRNNLAPVISRRWYKELGHFSLDTHCDSWVQDIANELEVHKPVVGIKVSHLREVLSDQTKAESQAVYPTSSPRYDSDEVKALREIDTNKLRRLL